MACLRAKSVDVPRPASDLLRSLLPAALLACVPWAMPAVSSAPPQPVGAALVLTVDGAIGPAAVDYVSRGLERAVAQGASLVVLQLDTPGGLDTSMREIIRSILASPVPVMTYVAPGGARAASAGTYIVYASHVAAMAPATNLGAATPVALGGTPGTPDPAGGAPSSPREPQRPADGANGRGDEAPRESPAQRRGGAGTAMERKAVNDAVAYLRSLAELRGRNVEWAEEAVRDGASLSAAAALERGVIDIVAPSLQEALQQAHGRGVLVGQQQVTLATRDLATQQLEPGWRTRLLAAITNPNIALLLLTIGVYGLLFEFLSPGALYPGTIGAICLLVGMYALSVLPVSYAGLALLALGLVLMVAEAFTPSLGVLGIGGAIAFVLGATMLFDGDVPGLAVSWPLLAGIAACAVAFTLFVARTAWTSRRRPAASGPDAMLGGTARVLQWGGESGHVWFEGERWSARGDPTLRPGEEVRVVAREGLQLRVAARAPPHS